jgi:folate-binding protein YgfZ
VGIDEEEVWLDVEPDATESLVDWFVKYRFRTKVEIEPRPSRYVGLIGNAARDIAGDGEFTAEGAEVFGGALGDLAVVDMHVHGPHELELPQAPAELHDVFRIESGIGVFGVDYGTRELPQEAGLTRIVPVDKGCYVGQETVARIHFRGHVNRVLRPLAFEGADSERLPQRELRLDGQAVGRVTSAVRSPGNGVVGLGMVRVEPPEGATVEVEGGGQAVLGPLPEGTKVKAS